ncbi:hypothetical protein PG985_011232 [Apiospora marii]|uniref:Uncharacterized protein n=1 Tax=Apiospora marii TaxID=335849 RepID=A0ABR1ST40_9PEZI
MIRLIEVDELKKPDVSIPIEDTEEDPETTVVVSLEGGTSGAVPVSAVEAVILGSGSGGANVEVAISLPLVLTLGNPEVAVVCDPVMVFDAEAVSTVLLVVILPKGYGVEVEDNPVVFRPIELEYDPSCELAPGAVGLPCPEGPGGGVSEPGLVVVPTTPFVDEENDTEPVGPPTITVVLKVGNGAGVKVDSIELTEEAVLDPTVDCGEGEIDPEPAEGPVSDALLGLVNGNGGDIPDADPELVTGIGDSEPVKVPAVVVMKTFVSV